MPKAVVRIIRTYEVQVEPVYGDDPDSICEKGLEIFKFDTDVEPKAETLVLLPEGSDL